MSRPHFTLNTWAATLAATAFLAVSPARSAPVDDCEAYSGTITTDSTQQCLVNGSVILVAQPGGDAVLPPGYQIGYVLTSTNGLAIEQVSPDPSFTVSGVNIWRIHSLVYDPNTLDFAAILDLDHAYQLQDMLVQGGGGICASLNISGAFTKTTECEQTCTADAGTISALNPDQCLVDGTAQLEALPDGNAVVPAGFSLLHVLTTGPDLIILAVGAEPSFSVDFEGPFTIHTLVYDPATLDLSGILFGETSAFEIVALLEQGGGPVCGSLDDAGAQFQVVDCTPVCDAYAGTLTAVASEVCRVDGSAHLDAVPNGDVVVPDGYSIAYILARANGIIENVEPDSDFEWPLLGEYVIHTLVYDPFTINPFEVVLGVTSIEEINSALIQGGGPVCGSLDLVGASFNVIDCEPVCDADAGTLTAAESAVCRVDGIAHLQATPNGDAVVPVGYSIAYILARANGIIENVEPNSDFEWPLLGEYVIHTLVYDPATLNPFTVVLGVTNISSINAWLLQGGGTICASLDLVGAAFNVIDCEPPCTAGEDADTTVCFTDASFSMIDAMGGDPCPGGSWTDPPNNPHSDIFNPAQDVSGVYTYTVLNNNGSVDVATLTVSVIECPTTCEADAGSLSNEVPEVCLVDGTAILSSTPNGDAVIPAGYLTVFLLSSGPENTLLLFENAPFFAVTTPGTYTIHTVVYDFNTWDLSGIEFGTTTVAEMNALFIQGGGNVCASLDVAGAQFFVSECPNACNGAAGLDATVEVCNDGSVTELFPLIGGDPLSGGTWFSTSFNQPFFDGFYDSMTGQGGTFGYVVSAGPDCPNDTAYVEVTEIECIDPCIGSFPDAGIGGDILQCDSDPAADLFNLLQGTPDAGGTWTGPDGNAFSGIFDPASNASGVYVYTVFDLLDCEPDTTQLNMQVIDCPEAFAQLVAWPNPSLDLVSMRFPAVLSGSASIDITDALGRSVHPRITIAGDLISVDVRTMPAGTYTLRVFDGDASYAARFARARD